MWFAIFMIAAVSSAQAGNDDPVWGVAVLSQYEMICGGRVNARGAKIAADVATIAGERKIALMMATVMEERHKLGNEAWCVAIRATMHAYVD